MYRDPSEFRERFKAYKEGKSVREIYGLPGYAGGSVPSSVEDTADFLRLYEGFRDKTYLDGKGIPTIGYGFTDSKFVNKGIITKKEADIELKKQIQERQSLLRNKLGPKIWDSLSNDSKKALTSYHFNYPAGFKENTKFMKYWRAGRYADAIKEVNAGWNDSANPGLRTRRIVEQSLLRSDPVLFSKPTSLKPANNLIQHPDALRVVTTIPQEQVIDYNDRRNTVGAEIDRAIWAHNVMKDIEGMAYDIPVWESKSLPALEPIDLDVTSFKTYSGGKLPGYQGGLTPEEASKYIAEHQGTILQGHRWSPLSDFANSTWRDYNNPFVELFIYGGLGNIARGLQQLFESWNKEASGIADPVDHASVLFDILTGANGKIVKDSAKELIKNTKKAVKKTILPAKASVKKEIKTLQELVEYHKLHPEELKPLKSKAYDDILKQVYKLSNYKQQKAGGKPLEFIKDEAYTAEFPNTVKTTAYHSPNGSVFDRVATENMNKFKIMGPHEYHHLLEEQIKYTPLQASILEQAFPLSEEFKKAHPNFNYLRERAAMNSELAYAIGSKYGFPVGPEFDNVVLNMSPWELEEIASGLSAYNKDASAQRILRGLDVLPTPVLKDALMRVPAGIGLYAGMQNEYSNGKLPGYKNGKIYIKPKNRGKFNATKKRTGKTTEELTHSKNPITRKRAIFALNAKKWKH